MLDIQGKVFQGFPFIPLVLGRQSLWVFVGYIISYLPFALISRVMWNYHYFIPLLYSLIAGAVAVNTLIPEAVILPSFCAARWRKYATK